MSLSVARKTTNSTILSLNALAKHGTPRRASEVTGSHFLLRSAGDLGAKGLAGHLRPMDGAVWLRSKPMRCLKEDMATDSLVGAWVTIYCTGAYDTWAPAHILDLETTC